MIAERIFVIAEGFSAIAEYFYRTEHEGERSVGVVDVRALRMSLSGSGKGVAAARAFPKGFWERGGIALVTIDWA